MKKWKEDVIEEKEKKKMRELSLKILKINETKNATRQERQS